MENPTSNIKRNKLKILSVILAVYILFALIFYWASGDQLFYRVKETKSITATDCAAVMTDKTTLSFDFTSEVEYLDDISLLIGTYGRQNDGELLVRLFDGDAELAHTRVPTADLKDYVYQSIAFDTPVTGIRGKKLTVSLTAEGVPEGEGVSLWYGTSISAGKFEIPDKSGNVFRVNGNVTEGKICYTAQGRNDIWIGPWYWVIAAVFGVLLAGYVLRFFWCSAHGKKTLPVRIATAIEHYTFLIKQLVARDFKRKYKRSALGVCWSFLNPLLTMLVQYFVFSTIFKNSIENFIIYLLTGIIAFNFFGEAVGLGLSSIVDNAHLINKVYMPKIIYPLSRVLSSVINLLMSLVPLFIVMLITGVPITKAVFLLPIGLICLLVFCLGLSMMLSTSMVFFQDTMFLWNVVSTLWQYLTPTFYPVDIIPESWLPIYKLNPMYQYITFMRSILMEGVAPEPELYFGCIISAVAMFLVGYAVFRKNQDKFVLYL